MTFNSLCVCWQCSLLVDSEEDELLRNEQETSLPCLSADISIALGDGSYQTVLSECTPIPVRRQLKFTLPSGQTSFCLHVLQGPQTEPGSLAKVWWDKNTVRCTFIIKIYKIVENIPSSVVTNVQIVHWMIKIFSYLLKKMVLLVPLHDGSVFNALLPDCILGNNYSAVHCRWSWRICQEALKSLLFSTSKGKCYIQSLYLHFVSYIM